MESRQWLNRSQPQTLQIATMLLYINAITMLLGVAYLPVAIPLLVAQAAGAFGIANEQKWGYYLGIAAASLVMLFMVLLVVFAPAFAYVFNLAFDIAVVALLVHPMSRSYQKIWFH